MTILNMLEKARKFEIQKYEKPKNFKHLKSEFIPFSGSPLKHPFDAQKIVLVADPYSTNTFYYEFRAEDIGYVEEMPNITNIDGETVPMARVWIKKRSIGVRCTPFVVENLSLVSGGSG